MKRHNIYLQLTFLLGTLSVLPMAYAQTTGPFVPIAEPILNIPQPKSNIHMVLDDSGSMGKDDVYMLEHAYGEGEPVCKVDARAVRWGKALEEEGMYNPFPSEKTYKPWKDDNTDEFGLIDGKSEPPPYNRCLKVERGIALSYVVQEILNRYRDKAYVGANVINKYHKVAGENHGLITLELKDYAGLSEEEFKTKLQPLLDAVEDPHGGTPTGEGLYHAMKILRGGPIPLDEGDDTVGKRPNEHFPYYRYETPLHYRCQESHIVNMSDGKSHDEKVYGIFIENFPYLNEKLEVRRSNPYNVAGVSLLHKAEIDNNFIDIGQLAAAIDLRNASKPIWNNSTLQWNERLVDDAGM